MFRKIHTILSITVISFILFLSIGYAVVSTNLDLTIDLTGKTQDNVFITDFVVENGNGTLGENSYFSTLLTSNITLSSTSSTLKCTVTVHNNNSDTPYVYIGTKYSADLGYDNSNIKFTVGIDEGDWIVKSYENATSLVMPGESKTFSLTFSHTKSGSKLSLSSLLNFQFVPLPETQVVTLEYKGNEYRDCFLKTETVATFPDVKISPTTTANNVARCNGDSLATYSNGEIKVTQVYSDVYASSNSSVTANNTNNTIKCKIYDTLTDSLRDTSFESSNYTRNNFLVLNDITDAKATAEIPENSYWFIDLNSKTITYTYNNKLMILKKKSKVVIHSLGTIQCGNTNGPSGDFAAIAELNHENAQLQLSGGSKYICESGGDAIKINKGKLVVRYSTITNYGNVFRIGLEPSEEKGLSGDSSAGTGYYVELSVFQSDITSTAANVVHSTSRQKVFASFVESDLVAGNTVLLCNNVGVKPNTDPEPEVAVWENVMFYVTGGTIEGRANDFFTHGTKVFYTESVNFPSIAYPDINNGFKCTGIAAVINAGIDNYAVKNLTSSVSESWFYVLDRNGNRMKASNGTDIKVGDKLEILSYKNESFALDLKGASYSIGTHVQIYTDNNTAAQRWTFVVAGDKWYHLATFKYPTYILYTHSSSNTIDIRRSTLNEGSGYWGTWSGAKFRMYYQTVLDANGNAKKGYYTFDSPYTITYTPEGQTSSVTKNLSLDIPGGTMENYNRIRVYQHNDSQAQIWKINK